MHKIILLLLLSALHCCLFAQSIHDESYLDKSFWEFKQQLSQAVMTQDKALLKSLLAASILESKDGCGNPWCSPDDFMRYFFDGEVNSANTWKRLATTLRFGFRRLEDKDPSRIITHAKLIFQAPSYWTKINRKKEVLVLGEHVNIREQPSVKAPVIRKASYESFSCDCNIEDVKLTTFQRIEGIPWLEIYLENGKVAYISAEYTSYLQERELTVAKVKGKWKIISFYAAPGC